MALTAAVPVRRKSKDRSDSTSLMVVDEEGTISFWTAELPASRYEWVEGVAVRTGRRGVKRAACSAECLTALGEQCICAG